MSIRLDYQPLGQGLDEASGVTNPQPGRVIGIQNFELVLGDEGLRRVNGYEVFDGRAAPSDAELSVVGFELGTTAIAAGETVTTGTGSAYVVAVTLDSGSWVGGDAAGSLVVTAVTGTISDGQALQVSAVTRATTTGFSASSLDDANYAQNIASARNYYRALIQKPTGEGEILGVKAWLGVVYCLRNAVGGATATLWRSTTSGWTAVRTGLRPGGAMRGLVANFTGNSAEQALYLVDGKNRYMRVSQAHAVTFGPAVYPTEGTSTTSVTPGSGSKSFTTTETSRSWTNGQELIAYSAASAGSYMIGTVTSSTGTSVTINVTSFAGSAAADWHICRTDGVDRPYLIAEHRNYLMLAYPLGQLQTSDVGSPMVVGTTSDAFGVGDEITDLRGMRGNVLGVFTASGVSLLYGDGSDGQPWEMRKHTASSGSRLGGAQEMGGDAVYVSASGIHSLSGTQAFGDFAYTDVSLTARSSLRDLLQDYRCTAISRKDGQYRIYGNDGAVLVMTLYGAPSVKTARFTKLRYPLEVTCVDSTMLDSGEELMVFGTSDGWVMRERIGTTFNGEEIEAFFRTSYWHSKAPQLKKRFRKLIIDVDTGQTAVQLYFRQDIDFGGLDQANAYTYTASPGGGYYDASYWNEFFWDGEAGSQLHASIDGVGRHMSLVISCAGDFEPFIVRGLHTQYSPLGLLR